MHDINIKQ